MIGGGKSEVYKSFRENQMEKESLYSICALAQKKIYAFTYLKRIPIFIDMKTWKMELQDELNNYDPSFFAIDMIYIERDIYALEINGRRLMKYSIDDKKCQYYSIFSRKKEENKYASFAKYGQYIYIFSSYSKGVIKFDIKTTKIDVDKRLYLEIINYKADLKQKNGFIYFQCGFQWENKMWLFLENSELVIIYNMENDTWEQHIISSKIGNCICAQSYKGKIYILNSIGEIYCWNIIDDIVDKLVDCVSSEYNSKTFSRIAITDRNIFLFPCLGNDIFKINRTTRKIEKYEEYPSDFQYYEIEKRSKFYGCCEDEVNYYFAMPAMNYIFVLNKLNGKEHWIRPEFPSYSEYIKICISYNKEWLNEVEYNLENIFEYLENNKKCEKKKNISVGNQIWGLMREKRERGRLNA